MTDETRPLRVLHCITSLLADGAQQMLLKLAEQIPPSRFEFRILNLREETPFAERFRSLDIPVENIGMRPALPSWRALRRIGHSIDSFSPDIIQGWMYHGNIAALAGRAMAHQKPPVLWNIRKAVENIAEYRPLTQLTLKVGAALSSRPEAVIYCGSYIASQHTKLGYSTANQRVIPNGFDTERFTVDRENRAQTRAAFGLPAEATLVGMMARYHPHKDHANFLRAAAAVATSNPNVRFVLAGRGLDSSNSELVGLATELGISSRLHLLGEQQQIEQLLQALDIYCLSSSAEGFPNSLGEAMACGLPCVSTDAGASAEVLGDCGVVVPTRDSSRLATGLLKLLSSSSAERTALGDAARNRILTSFSLPSVAREYENLYRETVSRSRSAAAHSPSALSLQANTKHNEHEAV